jgi:hypothetical protein
MRNKKLISLLIGIFFFTACGETIDSHWKDKPIEVDGKSEDWKGIPLYYEEDQNVIYGIVNDDSTLNILIRFNDSRLAHMFSRRGMILWLNDENEKEKKIGFHYQEQFIPGERADFMERERFNRNEDQKGEMRSPMPPQGSFSLAINDSITEISIKNVNGLAAAAGLENGLYCYEFSIPLFSAENLTAKNPKAGDLPYYICVSPKKEIKVGLEILPFSPEEREKIREHMPERRPPDGMSGGGMMGGGRRPGGMRGGRGMPSMPDMDGEEYWTTVRLAK